MSSFDTPRPRPGVALAAAAAVGLLSVGLTAMHPPPPAEAGAEPATELSPPPYSSTWIAIDTASPAITLNDSTGTVGAPQTLAEDAKCGVDQGAPGSRYLTLEGSTRATAGNPSYSTDLASFSGGSLGVKEKKSGTSCSMVDATAEGLRLTLGSGLATELGGTAVASSAYLDVELKQDAQILATLTTPSGGTEYFELRSGSTVDTPAPTGVTVPDGHVTVCNMPADSGPDSGVNDHCRWPISAPSWETPSDDGIMFTSMTLRAANGSFSLDGGSDGSVLPEAPLSPPTASIIELVDGTLDCRETTRTILADGDAPEVFVSRLDNADGSDCSVVPYSLSTEPGLARFLKPLDTQTTAQFIWDITWALPERDASLQPTTALQDLKIDYETGEPYVTLAWCPVSGYEDGTFVGYTQAPNGSWPAGITDQSELDNMQFACVISRDAQPLSGSDPLKIRSHDRAYVLGDAGMRF
jgi:hypothetical protein